MGGIWEAHVRSQLSTYVFLPIHLRINFVSCKISREKKQVLLFDSCSEIEPNALTLLSELSTKTGSRAGSISTQIPMR